MRIIIFAKRNLKEISRDILSLIFCIAFPIVMLLVFQLILASIPKEAVSNVPQFAINNLSSSIAIFGFSFITMFAGMLISKDRTTAFAARLNSSPMKPKDFILGYTLPLIPIALLQVMLVFTCSLIFGLKFNEKLFLAIAGLLPSALLFMGLGLLIGSLFNDKAVGGVASIIINLAAILGGMFFPLENMRGAIVTIAYIFPFANCIKISSSALSGNFSEMLIPLLIVLAYTAVVFSLQYLYLTKR